MLAERASGFCPSAKPISVLIDVRVNHFGRGSNWSEAELGSEEKEAYLLLDL